MTQANQEGEFAVRLLAPEVDYDRLLDLLGAVALAEGRTTATTEQMRAALEWPKQYRWVVDAPDGTGRLAGYAILFHQTPDRCYADVKVHPAWRRQGIGHLLVDALVEQAMGLRTRYLAIDVAAINKDALRFLLSQGFRYRGDTWALSAQASAVFPLPNWPVGYTVRPYAEVNDLALWVEVSNRGFGDLWGHWENTPGLVDQKLAADHMKHFNPNGIFMVFDASGQAVGSCRTLAAAAEAAEDQPHILDEPAVIPEHRSVGLQAPHVRTAARWLQEQGRRPSRMD
jgi:GNAT superfamily N-acetyltransferase